MKTTVTFLKNAHEFYFISLSIQFDLTRKRFTCLENVRHIKLANKPFGKPTEIEIKVVLIFCSFI